jgi:NADH dehydrogenase FAD-containing subunit
MRHIVHRRAHTSNLTVAHISPAVQMSQQPLNILVVGGSYAGLSVARHFLDNIIHQLSTFEGAPTYRVILISPSTHLYWNMCAPRALVSPNLIDLEDIFVPIVSSFSQHSCDKFTFVQGWATEVDTGARKIKVELVKSSSTKQLSRLSKASTSTAPLDSPTVPGFPESRPTSADRHIRTETISYHALIIATGTSSHSPLYTLHGAHEETLAELRDFHRKLESAHSIIIVGGGPSGVETAGQLAAYYNRKKSWGHRSERTRRRSANHLQASRTVRFPYSKRESNISGSGRVAVPREREMERKKRDSGISAQSTAPPSTIQVIPPNPAPDTPPTPKTITLLSGGTRVLSRMPPQVSKKAERKLKELGVHVLHNHREISHTTDQGSTLTNCHLNNDMTITSDLHISATGVYPNTRFLPKTMLDEAGYVRTDRETLRVHGHGIGQRIYALGDCASYSRNSFSDVYNALPVITKNLHNDLLAHEYRLQTVQAAPVANNIARIAPKVGFGEGDRWEYEPLEKTMSGGRRLSARPAIPPLSDAHVWLTEHQLKIDLAFPTHPVPNPESISKNIPSKDNLKRSDYKVAPPTQHPNRAPLLTPVQAHHKMTKLEDAKYVPKEKETILLPITKYGGTGVFRNWRVPGLVVYLLKGRDYGVKKAKEVVERGVRRGRGPARGRPMSAVWRV